MKPIFSDDKNAIPKLKAKLSNLESLHLRMKETNRNYAQKGEHALNGLDFADLQYVMQNINASYGEKRPYPSYCLTNNNAEIRRCKKRIAELENKANPSKPTSNNLYILSVHEHFILYKAKNLKGQTIFYCLMDSLTNEGIQLYRCTKDYEPEFPVSLKRAASEFIEIPTGTSQLEQTMANWIRNHKLD